jgi:hypothetical protein
MGQTFETSRQGEAMLELPQNALRKDWVKVGNLYHLTGEP